MWLSCPSMSNHVIVTEKEQQKCLLSIFLSASPFTLDKTRLWERLQLVIIPRSNDSAVVTGIYYRHVESTAMRPLHPNGHAHLSRFFSTRWLHALKLRVFSCLVDVEFESRSSPFSSPANRRCIQTHKVPSGLMETCMLKLFVSVLDDEAQRTLQSETLPRGVAVGVWAEGHTHDFHSGDRQQFLPKPKLMFCFCFFQNWTRVTKTLCKMPGDFAHTLQPLRGSLCVSTSDAKKACCASGKA